MTKHSKVSSRGATSHGDPRCNDNTDYYTTVDNGSVMSSRNFNDGVVAFLRAEAAFVSKVLSENEYATLVELGCDKAQNRELARLYSIGYVGMDIRGHVIDALHESETNRDAIYIHGDLNDIARHLPRRLACAKTLCLLPFNLIGNLGDSGRFFFTYAKVGVDIVISSWQRSFAASAWRKDYYERCGLTGVHFSERDDACTFGLSGFQSHAYSSDFLMSAAASNGFSPVAYFENDIACMAHLRLLRP
jgi:hypothetical protein